MGCSEESQLRLFTFQFLVTFFATETKNEDISFREDVLIVEAPLLFIPAISIEALSKYMLLYSVYEVASFCGVRGRLGHPHK